MFLREKNESQHYDTFLRKTKINELDSNLVSQVESDNSEMLLTFDELQKAVILLKVDMLRAISINVDYVDADGD